MSISLLGSINVCKVNTGYADKIQSDRFENPSAMLCPLWNGQDSYGRFVHPDSYYTKNGGCNSAQDRVGVENFLRPQYMEYVALDAAGFRSPDMFGNPNDNSTSRYVNGQVVENFQAPKGYAQGNQLRIDSTSTQNQVNDYYRIVGSAGYQYGATNTPVDYGLNGVNGGGNVGCGRRAIPASQGNFVEGFVDLQANKNFDQRRTLSAVQGFKSSCNSCSSGAY